MVTGASSGIGSVFARKLAAQGYGLILVARRRDRLEALAGSVGGRAEILVADLADEAGLRVAAERAASEDRLDILVNNAGFGTRGSFWEADLAAQEQMHRLHVMATLRLTHAALAAMVPRGRGSVINVSSVAAFGRSAGNVSYCATKSRMNAFTEGLALELRAAGSPVRVQALCPGFTYSEFHDVLGVDRATIQKSLWMNAEEVVEASLSGLRRGLLFVVPGWRYRLFASVFGRLPVGLRMALQARSPHRREGPV